MKSSPALILAALLAAAAFSGCCGTCGKSMTAKPAPADSAPAAK